MMCGYLLGYHALSPAGTAVGITGKYGYYGKMVSLDAWLSLTVSGQRIANIIEKI